jgi:NitT/TauT family transport system substrate-binding protein
MLTRRTALKIGLSGALVAGAAPHVRAADPDEVKIGSPLVISDAPMFIADAKGYAKEQGLKLTMIDMQTGPHMIAPLGTGQIDIAAAATSAGLYNADARGIGLKIVADKGSNLPGYSYVPLVLRKELVDAGKYKTLKDLKGLRIAEPGKGGSTGSTVYQALKKAGLTYEDASHPLLPFPEMVTGLEKGAIDAAILPEPFATFSVEKGFGFRVPTDSFYPRQTVAVVLYGDQFMKKRTEVAQRFMLAYLKAARFYNGAIKDGHFGGPNAEELIDILVQKTRYKDKALYQKVTPNGCDPDGHVYKPSLQTDLDFWREQKFVEGKVGVDDVLDDSWVEAGLKALGPYKPV